jgi:hypothetical protein
VLDSQEPGNAGWVTPLELTQPGTESIHVSPKLSDGTRCKSLIRAGNQIHVGCELRLEVLCPICHQLVEPVTRALQFAARFQVKQPMLERDQ